MSEDEKKVYDKFIDDVIIRNNKITEGQFEVINVKLDGINNHLGKINGRVNKHEDIINAALEERARHRQKEADEEKNRVFTCPKTDEINELKSTNITERAMKRYNTKLFVIGISILGLLFTAVSLLY